MNFYHNTISSYSILRYFLEKLNLYHSKNIQKKPKGCIFICNLVCAAFIYAFIILTSIGPNKHIDLHDWPLINNKTNFTKYYNSSSDIEVANEFNENFIGKFPNCMDFILSFISLGFTLTISKQSTKVSILSIFINIALFSWDYYSLINLVPTTYEKIMDITKKNMTDSEMILFHLNSYYDIRITNTLFNFLIKTSFFSFVISNIKWTKILFGLLILISFPFLVVIGIFVLFHILIIFNTLFNQASRADNGFDLYFGFIFALIPFGLIFLFWSLTSALILYPFQKIIFFVYSIDVCFICKKCKSSGKIKKNLKKIIQKDLQESDKDKSIFTSTLEENSLKVPMIEVAEKENILTVDKNEENRNDYIIEESKILNIEDNDKLENKNNKNDDILFNDLCMTDDIVDIEKYPLSNLTQKTQISEAEEENKVSLEFLDYQCWSWMIIIIYKLYICYMNLSSQFCYFYYRKMNIFSIMHIFISLPYFSLNIYSFQINTFVESTIDLYSKISSLI